MGARNREATRVPEEGPFCTSDDAGPAVWTPREVGLEPCPFLGSSGRARQADTQHSRGPSLGHDDLQGAANSLFRAQQ